MNVTLENMLQELTQCLEKDGTTEENLKKLQSLHELVQCISAKHQEAQPWEWLKTTGKQIVLQDGKIAAPEDLIRRGVDAVTTSITKPAHTVIIQQEQLKYDKYGKITRSCIYDIYAGERMDKEPLLNEHFQIVYNAHCAKANIEK